MWKSKKEEKKVPALVLLFIYMRSAFKSIHMSVGPKCE